MNPYQQCTYLNYWLALRLCCASTIFIILYAVHCISTQYNYINYITSTAIERKKNNIHTFNSVPFMLDICQEQLIRTWTRVTHKYKMCTYSSLQTWGPHHRKCTQGYCSVPNALLLGIDWLESRLSSWGPACCTCLSSDFLCFLQSQSNVGLKSILLPLFGYISWHFLYYIGYKQAFLARIYNN